jgi:rhodanese-related sulfurtransferase
MSVKRVSPEEAQTLVEDEGYVYVDVRSIPEFEAGHPKGANNVPWKHMDARGASDNEDFVAVM